MANTKQRFLARCKGLFPCDLEENKYNYLFDLVFHSLSPDMATAIENIESFDFDYILEEKDLKEVPSDFATALSLMTEDILNNKLSLVCSNLLEYYGG